MPAEVELEVESQCMGSDDYARSDTVRYRRDRKWSVGARGARATEVVR